METNQQSFFYNRFYSMDSDPRDIFHFFEWLFAEKFSEKVLRIADVGCGTGRMIELFANAGHDVTGFEPDDYYFQEAKKLESGKVRVLKKGFTGIDDENRYHAILAVNGPFEYLLTPDDRSLALRKMYRALKPGGIVFLEVVNFLLILKNYKPEDDSAVESGNERVTRHVRHEFDFVKNTMRHFDHFERFLDGKKIEEADKLHEFGMFSLSELEFLLRLNGFTGIETYNSYNSRSPEPVDNYKIRYCARKAE